MNPISDQLHDIHGLDNIPWWPLAPGWWFIVGVLILSVIISLGIAVWWGMLRRDWRRDARRRLRALGAKMHHLGAKEVTAQIAELLRRIAMARYGRTSCASLTGEVWLNWLTVQDPVGFQWRDRGRVLIDLPYAPPIDQVHHPDAALNHLQLLLEAVLPWIERDTAQSNQYLLMIQKMKKYFYV